MDNLQITFHPMTSETSTTPPIPIYSPIFDVSGFSKIHAVLDVEGIGAGSPSLLCTIEDSMDGIKWRTAGTFPVVISAPTLQPLDLTNFGRFVRAAYTYSGPGDTFTFSLLAIAREF